MDSNTCKVEGTVERHKKYGDRPFSEPRPWQQQYSSRPNPKPKEGPDKPALVSVRQRDNPLLSHLAFAYQFEQKLEADISGSDRDFVYVSMTYLAEFPLYLENRVSYLRRSGETVDKQTFVILHLDDERFW